MKDKVFVKNLVLPCSIGVSKEERTTKQNVIIDIEILTDLKAAGVADNIDKTVSYSEVLETATDLVTKGKFNLIESLAESLASLLLKNKSAAQVIINVRKEKYGQKPLMGIEITRDQIG